MGLDMYLEKRTYIAAQYEHRNASVKIEAKVGDKTYSFDPAKVSEVIESVGYWRKANQIHKWFVDNTQDGEDRNGDSEVSREQLKELLALCRKVKEVAILEKGMVKNGQRSTKTGWEDIMVEGEVIVNAEQVAELLPTQSGFFFGGTGYDGYYMRDIDNTIKILEALPLDDADINVSYRYIASW